MNIAELEQIMVEYGVTLRAIPAEVYGIYETTHAEEYPDGQISYLEEFKREMLITKRIPKDAGKFILEYNCGTGKTVCFSRQEYYDSIEEAIKALPRSGKPVYHDQ